MKWLDKDFRENVSAIVDADGNLFIGGIPFSPVAILESNEDNYTEAFSAWFNGSTRSGFPHVMHA